MPTLRVEVLKGKHLDDDDDSFIKMRADNTWYSTKVVKECANPVWNETFEVKVADPLTTPLLFTLWDFDKSDHEAKLQGVCAVGVGDLKDNTTKTAIVPFVPHKFDTKKGGKPEIQEDEDEEKEEKEEKDGSGSDSDSDEDKDEDKEEDEDEEKEKKKKTKAFFGKKDDPVLFIRLTALDFQGEVYVPGLGGGEGCGDGGITGVGEAVNELQAINDQLKAELETFKEENDRHKALNEELKSTTDQLESKVGELTGQVDRFTEQNDRLEGQVTKLHEENAALEQTRVALQADVARLTAEVDVFTKQNDRLEGEVDNLEEQNDRLEDTRNAIDAAVGEMKVENEKMAEQNSILQQTNQKLEHSIGELQTEIDRLGGEVKALTAVREQLDGSIEQLNGEVTKFQEENAKLQETSKNLATEVSKLDNKMKVLDGEMKNLEKTRDMLDAQVTRIEEQNNQLKSDLGDLKGIQEGMAALAEQQGEDYTAFVTNLNDSLARHEQLLSDFHRENQDLANNRKQIQIDSYIALSNSFAMWDCKIGLDVMEFEGYMSMLGSDFDAAFAEKFGGDKAAAFAQLDTDGSGTLNISELRNLLNEIVVEEEGKLE